mmetsp:Transcript_35398/g.92620  ORF Transcript_35398/g.92620 Transcript_35398/m.92620 type:complete len:184 (+) Transcript_35398:102-653(+)
MPLLYLGSGPSSDTESDDEWEGPSEGDPWAQRLTSKGNQAAPRAPLQTIGQPGMVGTRKVVTVATEERAVVEDAPPKAPRYDVSGLTEPAGGTWGAATAAAAVPTTGKRVKPTGDPKRDGSAAIAAVLAYHRPLWAAGPTASEEEVPSEGESFEDFTKRSIWETGPNYGNLWQSDLADIRYWR